MKTWLEKCLIHCFFLFKMTWQKMEIRIDAHLIRIAFYLCVRRNGETDSMAETDFITFETEEGEKIPFYVIEETMVAGVNYLLVSGSEDEETEAYIMREVTTKDDEAVYEMVEDEGQLEALSKVFSELLDDVDIEM